MKKSRKESLSKRKAKKMTLGDFMNHYSYASMCKMMQEAFFTYKPMVNEAKKIPSHKVVKI